MTFRESGKLKAVTFSYDDGVTQDVQLIQLMNKYGLKGTFNLNSELLGTGYFLTGPDYRICHYKIRPEDVKGLYEGHEIAAHTLTHLNLTTLSDEEVIRQVEQDRRNLSQLAGYEVVGMAYPCGGVNNDDRVAQLIKEHTGIRYCRTVTHNNSFEVQENLYRFNPTSYHHDFDSITDLAHKLIEAKPDRPQIFYIWGHSYEQDFRSDYWEKLEEFFKLISGHDDIFYGTNKEVLL
jgi:peptidoglycan/xylan/chitin deacetylase (PgdA/CDA1 family)